MKIKLSDRILKVYAKIKKSSKKSLVQIALDMGLTVDQISYCVKKLKEAKYLKRDKNGKLLALK